MQSEVLIIKMISDWSQNIRTLVGQILISNPLSFFLEFFSPPPLIAVNPMSRNDSFYFLHPRLCEKSLLVVVFHFFHIEKTMHIQNNRVNQTVEYLSLKKAVNKKNISREGCQKSAKKLSRII